MTKFKMASYSGKRTRLYNVQETREMRLMGDGEEESEVDNDTLGISSTEEEEMTINWKKTSESDFDLK